MPKPLRFLRRCSPMSTVDRRTSERGAAMMLIAC
jgi:hypothetical protein